MYAEYRDTPPRRLRSMDRAGDYDDRHRRYDDGYLPRRRDDSRRPRRDGRDDRGRDDRDYEGMYDDGYRARNARDDHGHEGTYDEDYHGGREDRYVRKNRWDREAPGHSRAEASEDYHGGREDRYYWNDRWDREAPEPSSRAESARPRDQWHHPGRGYAEPLADAHQPPSQPCIRVQDAGSPSNTVMIEGLPRGTTVSVLRDALSSRFMAANIPDFDVRVTPSRDKCRAFVQFPTTDQALAFVERHYPRLRLDLPQFTDDVAAGQVSVYIHYAHKHGDVGGALHPLGAPAANWSCLNCRFPNFAYRARCKHCSHAAPVPGEPLGRTGAADVGRDVDKKVPILVVYPLPLQMDENALAHEMKRLELIKTHKPRNEAPKLKSTAPSVDGAGYGARPGSLHRVFLMRDTVSNAPYPYGFVEFWSLDDAHAALKKFQMTRSFEIGGNPVTIATIHMGVFVPEDRTQTPGIDHLSFAPLFNPTLRIRYRDLELYPSQMMVAAEPPANINNNNNNNNSNSNSNNSNIRPSIEKLEPAKVRKRKADESLSDSAPKKAPVMASQMAIWQRKHDELRGVPQNDSGNTSSEGPEESGPVQDAPAEAPKRAAPVRFSMPTSTKPDASAKARPANAKAQGQAEPEKPVTSFADPERIYCLLCMMKYKTVEDLALHETSKNHKAKMQDEETFEKGMARMVKRGLLPPPPPPVQYRDRAAERREAQKQETKQGTSQGNPKPEAQKDDEPEVKKPAESKGKGMLAKMGWTSGCGLGANGEGPTQALTVNAYKSGVGLGAEGGLLGDAAEVAQAKTVDSYSGYLTAVQNKARERFQGLE